MPAINTRNSADASAGLSDLNITEILNAPRSLTWRTWTEPHRVAEWWGPREFTNTVHAWDARPGGLIRIEMRARDGRLFPMNGIFHEVREPEFLDFTTTAKADEQGSDQLQVRHNVTFEEHDGKTKVTVQSRVIKTTPATVEVLAGMEEGWNQSFDRLADLLAKL